MRQVTCKIRIQVPSSHPRGIADVIDAETGQPLNCRSLDLHVDAENGPTLTLELMELEALVVGTWECRLVKEEAL